MSILETAKEVFLDPTLDDETLAEHNEDIASWTRELQDQQGLIEWQKDDITKIILQKVNREFVSVSIKLGSDKFLTEAARTELFAKQDACRFMFEMMSVGKDAKASRQRLLMEIKQKTSQFL
jgi:hypothetical protein